MPIRPFLADQAFDPELITVCLSPWNGRATLCASA